MGSKNDVYIKWSCTPFGDFNCCKGKEPYPTITFQCISNFKQRLLGVSCAQYCTHNDTSALKQDHNVHAVQPLWYFQVKWEYFTINGEVRTDTGYYSICDNGYLWWPTSISPCLWKVTFQQI
jgi:hypothetical protein